jgi:heptosyltransferase-2
LGQQLKSRRYRHAFILPNSFKSALVPFFAEVPVRTGFRGEFRYVLINDMRMLNRSRLPRMVDQFVSLGVPAGADLPEIEYPQLTADEVNLARCLEALGLDADRPVLGICPGAEFGDAKRWPERHFATLAGEAITRGMQVWIFGGPGDVAIGQAIRKLVAPGVRDHIQNLAGKTSVIDVIDLISHCKTVISNDSGLMHIAAATGRPLIALFGSTSPAFTPPLSDRARILSEDLSCSPCFKRNCPLGHKDCLNGLLPARLIPLLEVQLREALE